MSDYKIEIEIYEGKGGHLQKDGDTVIVPDIVREGICAWMYGGDGEQSYKVGRRFSYPEEASKLCPWLLDSLRGTSGHCADLAGPAAPLRDVALSRAHLESADGPFRHPHRPRAPRRRALRALGKRTSGRRVPQAAERADSNVGGPRARSADEGWGAHRGRMRCGL